MTILSLSNSLKFNMAAYSKWTGIYTMFLCSCNGIYFIYDRSQKMYHGDGGKGDAFSFISCFSCLTLLFIFNCLEVIPLESYMVAFAISTFSRLLLGSHLFSLAACQLLFCRYLVYPLSRVIIYLSSYYIYTSIQDTVYETNDFFYYTRTVNTMKIAEEKITLEYFK